MGNLSKATADFACFSRNLVFAISANTLLRRALQSLYATAAVATDCH